VYSVIASLHVKPDMVDQFLEVMGGNSRAAAAELLEPGGQVNTFATPAFPGALPEARS
jgi:hypothetical protein